MIQGRRWLRIGITVNLLALMAVIAFVLAHAFPSTEAVRVRNAFLIDFEVREGAT